MTELWMWVGFLLLITFMLVLDLGVLNKTAHRVSSKEAFWWSIVWIGLALAFGGVIWKFYGVHQVTDYLTAYLIEKSLSVDNLFIFVLVFKHFKVEDRFQHRVLFWGVIGAVVMRAIFIFAGVALIQQFHWVTYIFGVFLVYTGLKLFFQKDGVEETEEMSEGVAVKVVSRYFSLTKNFDGQKFFTFENGKRFPTPLFLVLVVVEITDLIFAVDSIPAVLAVSSNPFIVFTSNIFAVMGLRSLYFLLADVIDRFVYLKTGLSVILTFIGVKMILAGIDDGLKIPSTVSLAVVAAVLLLSVFFSILKTSSQSEKAHRNE